MASTGNNVRIPEDVFLALEAEALALGKTADDLATERLRESMRERSWQDMLVRGRKYGEASGIIEDQVTDVVHDWRTEVHER